MDKVLERRLGERCLLRVERPGLVDMVAVAERGAAFALARGTLQSAGNGGEAELVANGGGFEVRVVLLRLSEALEASKRRGRPRRRLVLLGRGSVRLLAVVALGRERVRGVNRALRSRKRRRDKRHSPERHDASQCEMRPCRGRPPEPSSQPQLSRRLSSKNRCPRFRDPL